MNTELENRLQKIEPILRSWLPENPDASWLEKVFSVPGNSINPALLKTLSFPSWDLLNRGGKRWRPLLMVLVAEAIAGDRGAEAALPYTPLVEFSHNASLIHDDIEDNSDERRGKPAVHLLYGTDTAINSGSFLYFLSLACINAAPEETSQVFKIWGTYMRRLHLGQAMDIAWHRDFDSLPEIPEYEKMCCLKTGCLARMAAVLGVHCGTSCSGKNMQEDPAEKPGEGAEKLGVGFQILDDVKNLTTGIPGKKRGDDIVEGKKSLPVLLYLHRYPGKRKYAASCFDAACSSGIEAPQVEEFIQVLEKAGVLEEAGQRGRELIQESRDIFMKIFSKEPKGRELLGSLIDFMAG